MAMPAIAPLPRSILGVVGDVLDEPPGVEVAAEDPVFAAVASAPVVVAPPATPDDAAVA